MILMLAILWCQSSSARSILHVLPPINTIQVTNPTVNNGTINVKSPSNFSTSVPYFVSRYQALICVPRSYEEQITVPGTSLSGFLFPVKSSLQLPLDELVDCLEQLRDQLRSLPAQASAIPSEESQRCNQIQLTVTPIILYDLPPMTPNEGQLLLLHLSKHIQHFGLPHEATLDCSRGFWLMGSIKIAHARYNKATDTAPF